jgi:F-type H+-transporting ATPase subunit epsilon
MSKQFKLKIITPERLVLEDMVDQVSIPTKEGEITILDQHIPLISSLTKGEILAKSFNEDIPFLVVGGFVEVKNNENGETEVAVLADFAEHVSEINEEVIANALTNSELLKKQMSDKSHVDFEHFETELEKSLSRIKIADKWRNKKYRR